MRLHRHRWERVAMLDKKTEIVKCRSCPARVARLARGVR